MKKVSEIKIKGNRGGSRPKKNWIGVIREDMKTYKVNKNMDKNNED